MSRRPSARIVLTIVVVLCGSAAGQDRAATVAKSIDEHNERIKPRFRDLKYAKMADSPPFVFYRGTNHLFWMDFGSSDRLQEFSTDKTRIWIQGDLHAYNFGSFDNDRQKVVYDLNDFDESMIADYQFDVWRMAVSLVLIGRLNLDKDGEQYVSDKKLAAVVDDFTASYLTTLKEYVGNDDEEEVEFTPENTTGKLDDFLKKLAKKNKPSKAREAMLDKWTVVDNERRSFKSLESEPPNKRKLEKPSTEEEAAIRKAMKQYGRTLSGKLDYDDKYFRVNDIARRLLAGTGSLGTPRFYILIAGKDEESDKDDRILDVKQQSKPTPYEYLADRDRRLYAVSGENDAAHHAHAYDALTKHTDDHLGWMHLEDVSEDVDGFYSVRERSPYKESFPAWLDPDEKRQPDLEPTSKKRLKKLASQWGRILATAHARADVDFDETSIPYSFEEQVTIAVGDNKERFQELVRDIAFEYATQVVQDWESWKAGR